MELLITGSKDFADKNRLFKFLDSRRAKIKWLICGTCSNLDLMILEYGYNNGINVKKFNSKTYDENGFVKGATLRNRIAAIKEATHVLIIDNGNSEGAKKSIEICQQLDKKHKIVKYI